MRIFLLNIYMNACIFLHFLGLFDVQHILLSYSPSC